MGNQLYPLKFKPVLKDKIWGGSKIKSVLGIDFAPLPNCGEAWVMSGVDENQTGIINGFLAGNELNELVEIYMGDLVGDAVYERFGNEFPILVKFIDAADYLSIQVHPDDELAAKRNIGYGKSEMWYIIDADPGSELISGFSRKVDRQTYLDHLKNKSLRDILNFEKVSKGDVFYMPAGRVHALGPGIFLAEIQQTSDTTYRIYDWDRVDAEGKSRDLHVEEALDAIDFNVYDDYKSKYEARKNGSANLVTSPYFTTNLIQLDQALAKDYTEIDSFVIYVCVEGAVTIVHSGETELQVSISQGEALLVPAAIDRVDLVPTTASKILEVYIV
ncbi:MAG: mannose-6-phosphate isomerase [Bacteroidetes bacterium HGW-Bacteroidetes-9]|jgi:mannose-6-phosphate isomerase|nr:MAG: mannose-6-phosphate isomerase [Bacteroidetes bacterium HGW-Bacteroidetes-9]